MNNTETKYAVKKMNSKFVVTKNDEPILLPPTSGQSIVTEFDNKEDAEKYLAILKRLKRQ
jgi:hypothetical protein